MRGRSSTVGERDAGAERSGETSLAERDGAPATTRAAERAIDEILGRLDVGLAQAKQRAGLAEAEADPPDDETAGHEIDAILNRLDSGIATLRAKLHEIAAPALVG